jgi:hypothetical protein
VRLVAKSIKWATPAVVWLYQYATVISEFGAVGMAFALKTVCNADFGPAELRFDKDEPETMNTEVEEFNTLRETI